MYFALTDEQRDLGTTVRELLADRFPLSKVREVFDDPDGDGSPAELWRQVGEQGWLAVLVPEEQDGLGLGVLDAQVIARALGAGAAPGPWRGTVLVTDALRRSSSPVAKEWLPRLAAGEAVGAVALETPVGPGETLTGTLPRVEYAALADVLVVALTDGGLALVDPRGAGVTVAPQQGLDLTSRLSTVELAGAPATRLEGAQADDIRLTATVLVAADLVGIARESLSRTVDYDRTREQFGRPVGSFQALKHAMADLHVAISVAEHAVLYAAYALDAGRPDAAQAVSVAKAKTSDVAKAATAEMIQFHGGIGYTWEHDAHFYFKRARRLAGAYGDAAAHRERIAKILVG